MSNKRIPTQQERPDLYDYPDCMPGDSKPIDESALPEYIRELLRAKREGWFEFALARLNRIVRTKSS